MKTKKWKARYSGDKSALFWHMVNSLPDEERALMYSLGVALQNLEHHVLDELRSIAPGFVQQRTFILREGDEEDE